MRANQRAIVLAGFGTQRAPDETIMESSGGFDPEEQYGRMKGVLIVGCISELSCVTSPTLTSVF